MPSPQSIEIRKGIVRDAVRVGVSIEEERRWRCRRSGALSMR
jgi:hypothetical protein